MNFDSLETSFRVVVAIPNTGCFRLYPSRDNCLCQFYPVHVSSIDKTSKHSHSLSPPSSYHVGSSPNPWVHGHGSFSNHSRSQHSFKKRPDVIANFVRQQFKKQQHCEQNDNEVLWLHHCRTIMNSYNHKWIARSSEQTTKQRNQTHANSWWTTLVVMPPCNNISSIMIDCLRNFCDGSIVFWQAKAAIVWHS